MTENEKSNIGKIRVVEKLIKEKEFVAANTYLQGIIPNNLVEQTFVDYFKTVVRSQTSEGVLQFSDGDLLIMEDLAMKCPIEYGPAVYLARSFFMTMESFKIFTNDCSWDSQTEKSGTSIEKASLGNSQLPDGVTLYPNPAKDNITIQFSEEKLGVVLTLYDVTGSLVRKKEYPNTGKQYIFPLTELPSGLYLMTVSSRTELFNFVFTKE